MRALSLVIGSVSCALLAGSCGGSGGGSSNLTLTLFSSAALDGWVTTSGQVLASTSSVQVGDMDGIFFPPTPPVPDGVRGLWSFDLSGLPPTATVLSATFTTFQNNANAAIYANHGVVKLDHLDYGPSLEASAYSSVAITADFVTLTADATLGSKSVDVTARVQADLLAARTRTQFRAHFTSESDADGIAENVGFTTAESTVDPPPVLTITYRP